MNVGTTVAIEPPPEHRLDWLFRTGVLAGFDAVLPLRQSGPGRDFMAKIFDQTESGWEHRYVMFVAVNSQITH